MFDSMGLREQNLFCARAKGGAALMSVRPFSMFPRGLMFLRDAH